MYYSQTTGGFYDDVANYAKNIPGDLVEIGIAKYAELLAARSLGKIIQTDQAGILVAVDPPATEVSEIWDCIKTQRDRRIAGGIKCGDHWYHSDSVSKNQHLANKDTARDQIAAGGAMADALLDPLSGSQIRWKTMSGDFIPLTCQLAFDIVAAAKSAELATYLVAEQHKTAMEASSDPASYDYSSGWPEIYADQ